MDRFFCNKSKKFYGEIYDENDKKEYKKYENHHKNYENNVEIYT